MRIGERPRKNVSFQQLSVINNFWHPPELTSGSTDSRTQCRKFFLTLDTGCKPKHFCLVGYKVGHYKSKTSPLEFGNSLEYSYELKKVLYLGSQFYYTGYNSKWEWCVGQGRSRRVGVECMPSPGVLSYSTVHWLRAPWTSLLMGFCRGFAT
jgi:hypothetical protein